MFDKTIILLIKLSIVLLRKRNKKEALVEIFVFIFKEITFRLKLFWDIFG